MSNIDDFLDSWVDVADVIPDLGTEPFFIAIDRHHDLINKLRNEEFEVREIDVADSQSDKDFVVKFGRSIDAPAHFGENWDALNDVLRERASTGAWKIAVVILGGHAFAAQNLHDYTRMTSILHAMSERMSNIEEPIGQLEIFYIEG
ncbi:MAG TPA: barstar family protein [Trebonia sp.]|jgi:hypothetical protein